MSGNKRKNDLISEQEYTAQLASISSSPENDSPGDSESDAGAEFYMGIGYIPEEDNDLNDDMDKRVYEFGNDGKFVSDKTIASAKIYLPESAKIVSSDQPAPWSNLDSESDTN